MTIELTDTQADNWLARVEDPATKRAEEWLRDMDDPEAMCCLGHLADIINSNGWWKITSSLWSWGGYGLPKVTYRGVELDQGLMSDINDREHRFPVREIQEWIDEARKQ